MAVLLLTAGCLPSEEPLMAELKGRWAAMHAVKLRHVMGQDSYPAAAEPTTREVCRSDYVTFGKNGIALHGQGKTTRFFVAQVVRRDSPRIILQGRGPMPGSDKGRIELILGNGEVRFDDVIDERGRSLRYDFFNADGAQKAGIRTIGDVYRLAFDLKQCT
jgi:hypothetical protein